MQLLWVLEGISINILKVFCFSFCFSCYAAQPVKALDLLIAYNLGFTSIHKDLNDLATHIGGRPTGSKAMSRALGWGVQRFQDAELKNAHLESYTAPRNWLPQIEQGDFVISQTATRNVTYPIRLAAMPYTMSTSSQGIEAPIYVLTANEIKQINQHKQHIKNHWLLIKTKMLRHIDDLLQEDLATYSIFSAAKKAGAVGILWQSNRPGPLLYRHSATTNGQIFPLPAALIEREGSIKILEALEAGKAINFKAILNNIMQESPTNYNVVAEIKGSMQPEEIVILGAHLDSWDLGQGALDNGCNVAIVIDVARQIAKLGQQGFYPKRTIRFVLYSGEEAVFFWIAT